MSGYCLGCVYCREPGKHNPAKERQGGQKKSVSNHSNPTELEGLPTCG